MSIAFQTVTWKQRSGIHARAATLCLKLKMGRANSTAWVESLLLGPKNSLGSWLEIVCEKQQHTSNLNQ